MAELRCDLTPAVSLLQRILALKPNWEFFNSLDDTVLLTKPCAFCFATSFCQPSMQDESHVLARIHELALAHTKYQAWVSRESYEDVRYRRLQLLELADDIEEILLTLPDMSVEDMVIYYNKVLDQVEAGIVAWMHARV